MKKLLALIAVIGLMLTASAQTTTTPQQTFFESVQGYFTSFNTNLADGFATDKVDIWMGTVNLQNQSMAASFGVEAPIWQGFQVQGVICNAAFLANVTTVQAGVAWGITKVDARFSIYGEFGYDFRPAETGAPFDERRFVEVGIEAKKMLTPNTFAGVRLGIPFFPNHTEELAPTFGVFGGFKL